MENYSCDRQYIKKVNELRYASFRGLPKQYLGPLQFYIPLHLERMKALSPARGLPHAHFLFTLQ